MPPLDYDRVYRLKAAHPELEIVLNGGIGSLDEAEAHLAHVDGVTLGRAAYQNPYLLAEVDRRAVRRGRCRAVAPAACWRRWSPTSSGICAPAAGSTTSTRHILGLYHGRPRARAFRRHLSEQAPREGAGVERAAGGDRASPRARRAGCWRRRNSSLNAQAASDALPDAPIRASTGGSIVERHGLLRVDCGRTTARRATCDAAVLGMPCFWRCCWPRRLQAAADPGRCRRRSAR